MKTNLTPHPTSFVGRETELHALGRIVDSGARLVTILGPPGAGKTRLATHYGLTRLDAYGEAGGVWFIDLSLARSLDEVRGEVARVLGGGDETQANTARAVRSRGATLIILDNFEQLSHLAPQTVARWVSGAPEACFLVTSRERLGLIGEYTIELQHLALPEPNAIHLSAAVRLFVERVKMVRSAYELTAEDAPAVAEIVRRVGGIPLAIELAAARMEVLDPRTFVGRMDSLLDLLSYGSRDANHRQGTLRSAVQWSWDLLLPAERSAMIQCSAFEGGFTLESAEAIVDLSDVPDAPPVLDVVQGLRSKSILNATPVEGGGLRFGMYELIREFGLEQLAKTSHGAVVRERHAHHFLGMAQQLTERGAFREYVEGLSPERRNLTAVHRAALGDGPGRSTDRALRVAIALEPILVFHGLYGALTRLLGEALDAPGDSDPLLRAQALCHLGYQHTRSGRLALGLTLLSEAADVARQREAPSLLGIALNRIAVNQRMAGHPEEALRTHARAQIELEGASEQRELSLLHIQVGYLLMQLEHYDKAEDRLKRARAIVRTMGDPIRMGALLGMLGQLLQRRGDWAEAIEALEEGIQYAIDLKHPQSEAWPRGYLARLQQELGRFDDARGNYERVLAVKSALGDRYTEAWMHHHIGTLDHEQRHWDEALSRYEHANGINEEIGNPQLGAMLHAALGALYATMDQLEPARLAFAEADRCISRIDSPPHEVAVNMHRLSYTLARARRATETGRKDEAQAHVDVVVDSLQRLMAGQDTFARTSPDVRLALRVVVPDLARSSLSDSATLIRTWLDDHTYGRNVLVVASDGRWFRPPGGSRVNLETRENLCRILAELGEERESFATQALSQNDLLAAGWPDERVMPSAGAARVRVALSTLRKMGLADFLVRRDGGYALDDTIRFIRSEDQGFCVAS